MPEEIVYGVCLPATGFSVLFVLLSLLTVISVLVSGKIPSPSVDWAQSNVVML